MGSIVSLCSSFLPLCPSRESQQFRVPLLELEFGGKEAGTASIRSRAPKGWGWRNGGVVLVGFFSKLRRKELEQGWTSFTAWILQRWRNGGVVLAKMGRAGDDRRKEMMFDLQICKTEGERVCDTQIRLPYSRIEIRAFKIVEFLI
ncbi:hypothetical protein Dimus_032022 [Dionaea muscipula]